MLNFCLHRILKGFLERLDILISVVRVITNQPVYE
jgi:hypothetical protein